MNGQNNTLPTPTPTLAQAQKPGNKLLEIAIMISISIIAAISIGLLVYTNTQLQEAQTDVDGKIDLAVAEAIDKERVLLEANFAEREKIPNTEFAGPDHYGRLSFMYPRTWSVFVAEDAANGGDFKAYLNPRVVPPVSNNKNRFALRVVIYDRPYDTVLRTYDSALNARPPRLTYRAFQVGNSSGARLDGELARDIVGSAVLLQIPNSDKTALIQTDTEVGRPDFETLIQTIKFN